MSEYSAAWKIVYATYPKLLRVLETLRIHSGRQPFPLGRLNPAYQPSDLYQHLVNQGFEPAMLAWRDSDELFGVRKIDKHLYQWHIRLHTDGEIRGHYEYSSEGNPFGHIFESAFRPDVENLKSFLGDYLV